MSFSINAHLLLYNICKSRNYFSTSKLSLVSTRIFLFQYLVWFAPSIMQIYRGYSNVFVEYGFCFIERSGKYLYFMSGEAMHEIYIFSLHE